MSEQRDTKGKRPSRSRRAPGGGSGSRRDGHRPGDYSRYPVDRTPGFNRWEPIDVPAFRAGDYEPPFQLHSIALKSSSRQSEVFVHDPIRALTGSSEDERLWEDDGFEGEPLLADRPSRVTTLVVRHERTLEHMVIRAMALTEDDGSVTLTVHKQEGT